MIMIEKINEYFIAKKDEKLIQFGYEKGEFFCYEINESGFYVGKIDENEMKKFKKLHKKWKKEETILNNL